MALPCPFCGKRELDVVALSEEPGDLRMVACNNCGVTGPVAVNEGEALAAWDTRVVVETKSPLG